MASKKKSARRRRGTRVVHAHNVTTSDNDNLSAGFAKLVPAEFRGTDRFLDVVCWNIRYFHDKDPARVERIVEVLAALNADVFVLEEIYEGSLDVVAEGLRARGAGHYHVEYGTTGGQQRVAMMWDLDWIRSKDDVVELFTEDPTTNDGKKLFPRRPLHAFLQCLTHETTAEGKLREPFAFQLVGLHLKSQRGGGEDQRKQSAKVLADWLVSDAPKVDADVIMLGDWNQPATAPAWKPLRDLEDHHGIAFASINDDDNFSHLMYQSKAEIGTRLDLTCVTISTMEQMANAPEAVHWTSLDDLLSHNPNAKQLKDYIHEISDKVSDHMPVVSRYFYTVAQQGPKPKPGGGR